jgi:glycosyltransferase involved in cell wall biosynthesis
MKSVAYFPHQPSGCFWYRTEHPMLTLSANGIKTIPIELDKDVEIENIASFHFYGATPFSMDKALTYLKEQHIKIVYDVDDVLDLIDETNPSYYSVKKDTGSFNQMIEYADEITVATPVIKEVLSQRTKTPITVLPNCYIPDEWIYKRIPHEEIRIGFAGSLTHVIDLIEIIPAIKQLQATYNVKFYIFGFGQDTYERWFKDFRYSSTEKGKEKLIELDKLLKEIKFEWIPFVNYKLYPRLLTELSLDIGLCPLKSTPFNNCRSASKAMEYTLSGALAIAEDVPPYQEDKTSILVKDNWFDKINYYCNNKYIRDTHHKQHLDWLIENRQMKSQFDTLKKVYDISL